MADDARALTANPDDLPAESLHDLGIAPRAKPKQRAQKRKDEGITRRSVVTSVEVPESAAASGDEGDVEDLLLLSKISRPPPPKPRIAPAQVGASTPPREKRQPKPAPTAQVAKEQETLAAPAEQESADQAEAAPFSAPDAPAAEAESETVESVKEAPAASGPAAQKPQEAGQGRRASTSSSRKSSSPVRKAPSPSKESAPAPRKEHAPQPPAPSAPATVPAEELTKVEKKLRDTERLRNELQLEIEELATVQEEEIRRLREQFAQQLSAAIQPLQQDVQVLRESNAALTGALAAKVAEGKDVQELVAGLKRQAEEARTLLPQLDSRRLEAEARVNELTRKLNEVDVEIAAGRQAVQQVQTLQAQLSHVSNHVSQTAATISALEVEVKTVKDERDSLITHALKIETEKAELDKKLGEARASNHQLIDQIKLAQEERDSFNKELDGIRGIASQYDELKVKLEAGEKDLEAVKSEAAEAKRKLEMAEAEVGSVRKELEAAISEAGQLKKDLEATKSGSSDAVKELESKAAEAGKELEAAKSEVAQAKAEVASVKAELDSAKAELEAAKAALDSAKAGFDSAKTELDSTKGELDSSKAELDSTKVELDSTKAELDSTKAELVDLKKRVEGAGVPGADLKSELAESQSVVSSLKAELESTKEKLEGAMGQAAKIKKVADDIAAKAV